MDDHPQRGASRPEPSRGGTGDGAETTTPIRRAAPVSSGTVPLPRRREQAHLEPQLREPGGAGAGTPFGAFAGPPADAPAEPDASTPPAGSRAAAFRAATRSPGPRDPQ